MSETERTIIEALNRLGYPVEIKEEAERKGERDEHKRGSLQRQGRCKNFED